MSEYYETIVVGGGPAGSSCAWKLKKTGKRSINPRQTIISSLKDMCRLDHF